MDFVIVNPAAAAMAMNVGTFGLPQAFLVSTMEAEKPEKTNAQEKIYPPLVINVTPKDAAIGVSPDCEITISYHKPIKIVTADSGSEIALMDVTAVKKVTSIPVSKKVEGNDLIVTPVGNLSQYRVYELRVPAGTIARADVTYVDGSLITTKLAEVTT